MQLKRRTPYLVVNCLVLALTATSVFAQLQPAGLPAGAVDRITRAVSSEMSRQNIPGLSVAVVTDYQLRWASGFGMSDLENFVPAKTQTVYRLASISKTITATAVMQLVEQGKLDLDAPVQKYVPSFPQKQWPVTTRQLLSHLGGIRHYGGEGESNNTRHYKSVLEGLDIFKNDPLVHEPGTKHLYSSYGFNLLGAVVEGASGTEFGGFVQAHIFNPAGMETMRIDEVNAIIPNRAQGYRKLPNGQLRNSDLADTSYKIPSGGFCSTVIDLAKFAIAVQTGKLVKPETAEQMFTVQKTGDGKPSGDQRRNYGLGWGITEHGGQKEVWHTGGQARVSTLLYTIPQQRLVVVLMTNLEGAAVMDLARQIAAICAPPAN